MFEERKPIVKPTPLEKFVCFDDGGFNAEMRWGAMGDQGYLVDNESFFVRSHAPTPRVDASSWKLRVEGTGLGRELELGYDALLAMPAVTVTRAMECAGNGRVFFEERQGRKAPGTPWRLGAIGVARWTGVPLGEVLKRAGLKETAVDVMIESFDAVRFRRPLPVAKATSDAILAFGMNGQILPPDHGYPVRAVVPGWSAVASIKWVGRVHVCEGPLHSPWNTEEYVLTGGGFGARREPLAEQGVKSALELPWPARLPWGPQQIRGRSWSAHGSIARVQYSLNGGETWRPTRLSGPNVPAAWVRWSFAWDAPPGDHEIRIRATDEKGNTQPDSVPWNDLGYLYDGIVGHPVEVR